MAITYADTLAMYGLTAPTIQQPTYSSGQVGNWWDAIPNTGIQKELSNAGMGLSWDQLSQQDQAALASTIAQNPNLLYQDVQGRDFLMPSQYNVRSIGDTNTVEQTPIEQMNSAYFGNYYAPTQSELLYRLSPEIAAKYGITEQTVAANRATQDSFANKVDSAENKAMDKEALLMALTVLTAGAAGGAFSGAAAGEGAAAGSAAGSGSAWGGLGDIAAGSGAAGSGSAGGAASGMGGGGIGGSTSVSGLGTGSGVSGLNVTGSTGTLGGSSAVGTTGFGAGEIGAYGSAAGTAGSSLGTSGGSVGTTTGTTGSSSGLLGNMGTKEAVALGSGLLGTTNGSKQAGTTTTTQSPWGPQQPYLTDAFEQARKASQGNALTQQANQNYQSVLGGNTVNPMLGLDNPYLQKSIDYANQDVNRAFMPAMNQANRTSGSYGNSGVADVYSKNMLDAYSRNATGMRMQDYSQQQNLQQQAVQNTLGFTQGANTYNSQPAQQYAQTVQGNYGGSTSTPYYTNPYANVIGGISTGLGLYNAYTGSK